MSLLLAASVISISFMFPVLLSLRTSGVAGVTEFCAATALAAAAICIMMTSGLAPVWFNAIVGSVCMIASCLFIFSGFRTFLGCKALSFRLIATILFLSAAIQTIFTYGIDSFSARVAFGASMAALIFFLSALTMIRYWPQEKTIRPYMLFCCFAAFGVTALHTLRAITVIGGLDLYIGVIEPRVWDMALGVSRLVFLPVFLLGVVLIIHGQLIANLRHIIAHDDLTGALSRRAFMAYCESRFSETLASNRPMALLVLDLDRFKQINDRHGHAGGDAALSHFASTVAKLLGPEGAVGRLGGEEFGIALPKMERDEAMLFAEALCETVRSTPVIGNHGRPIHLTVSIGLSMAEQNGTLPEMMILADMAVYEAKANGRDRVVAAADLHTAATSSTRALAATAAQMRAANGSGLPGDRIAGASP